MPGAARIKSRGTFLFSPDLRLLADSDQSGGDACVWDTTTGEQLSHLIGPFWFQLNTQFEPAGMAFSADGRFLAAANASNRPPEVLIWDVTTGRVVRSLRALRSPITGGTDRFHGGTAYWGPRTGLAWHPDGRLLAVATARDVCIFDVTAREADE